MKMLQKGIHEDQCGGFLHKRHLKDTRVKLDMMESFSNYTEKQLSLMLLDTEKNSIIYVVHF